jgi:hypothetical protein
MKTLPDREEYSDLKASRIIAQSFCLLPNKLGHKKDFVSFFRSGISIQNILKGWKKK